jgi:ABC-type lipoprotein export system ATPase subunit
VNKPKMDEPSEEPVRWALDAKGIGRRIGDRDILAGIDIGLEAGESVSLVGPSGCGKTALLSILGLLDRPDAGVLTIGTTNASDLTDAERAHLRLVRVGFIFQAHNLFEDMTALENVALPSWRLLGSRKHANERAADLLSKLGLASVSTSRASELSGGEAQRVAVARAIINEPEIVLADEPTGNLDSASAAIVMDALFHTVHRGAAILVATHAPEIAALATRSIRMLDGRIVDSKIVDSRSGQDSKSDRTPK